MDEEEKSTESVEAPVTSEQSVAVKILTKPQKRKKIGRRRLQKPLKRRGTYQQRTVGVVDADVAECLFSEDEMVAEFLEDNVPIIIEGDNESSRFALLDEPEPGTSAVLDVNPTCQGRESLSPLTLIDSVSTVSCESSEMSSEVQEQELTTISSRPVSQLGSRPSSSLLMSETLSDSRPQSAHSTGLESHEELQSEQDSYFVPPALEHSSLYSDTVTVSQTSISNETIEKGISKFKAVLPYGWYPISDKAGFHLLYLSAADPKAIQREIFISYLGKVFVSVHRAPVVFLNTLFTSPPYLSYNFGDDTVEEFIDNGLRMVKQFMQYKICVGANHLESRDIWGTVSEAFVDSNPYIESNYVETCRSASCSWLVDVDKGKRCKNCAKVMKKLMSRKCVSGSESDRSTPNIFLTHTQALQKLKLQQEDIIRKNKQIAYLKGRIQSQLESEGVDIDEDLNTDLLDVLAGCSSLSEVQKMFLQEQASYSAKANARSHRWHPSMIRLALHLKMVSSAAYEALRDSGAVKLPSSKSLYDYSHAITPQEGVSYGLVELVHQKVSKFEKPYQKFHALLCDEMHVSQNLVYRQSDGHLVGYTHLDEIEKEIDNFERFINGNEKSSVPVLANKVLAFMVKGLASDVKCVIAAYPCNQLTKDMLYVRAWEVISVLEQADVKILALVCDGSAVNRAFINMHTPLTKLKSGVVSDAINFCSPDRRPLFFISDVCHLLKTLRNCFYNSGDSEKKPRCLLYNQQKIVWKHIVRLYLTFKDHNFRKSYKLNAQNVFPNSYSCMKVRYAAEVLSNTVANDLKSQNWPDTDETVRFILNCNKFFDCLNGAFSGQHVRSRNKDLAPYSDLQDPRFDWLQSFLDYLEDWRKQAEALPSPPQDRAKSMLSRQTLEGIELTVHGFTGATKYLLDPQVGGAKFVMARAFSQDPLEQNFSKWRAGQGGSRNPNINQVLNKQVSVGLQRNIGVKARKGNVTADTSGDMQVTDEALPKRRKKS